MENKDELDIYSEELGLHFTKLTLKRLIDSHRFLRGEYIKHLKKINIKEIEKKQKQTCWNKIISDMKAREKYGLQKYKIPTEEANKDWLKELYEELLDAIIYLKVYREKNGN